MGLLAVIVALGAFLPSLSPLSHRSRGVLNVAATLALTACSWATGQAWKEYDGVANGYGPRMCLALVYCALVALALLYVLTTLGL